MEQIRSVHSFWSGFQGALHSIGPWPWRQQQILLPITGLYGRSWQNKAPLSDITSRSTATGRSRTTRTSRSSRPPAYNTAILPPSPNAGGSSYNGADNSVYYQYYAMCLQGGWAKQEVREVQPQPTAAEQEAMSEKGVMFLQLPCAL